MALGNKITTEDYDSLQDGPVDSLVSLRWSPEPPTESGYYWLKVDNDRPEIVLVRGDTLTCEKYVLEFGYASRHKIPEYVPDCQWMGPLPFPEAN